MRTLVLVSALLLASPLATQSFVNFETPQVHGLAVSADGQRLFAVNTPDNRLSVFSLARPALPLLLFEVPVGLEPVSVRPRTDDEVWVVNHLSDSVNVVSLSQRRILATIPVKDEPGDVVFAGQRAFVTAAASREVHVFDVVSHKLLARIAIFGDEPRALAASADGSTVWAAVHRSGNKTTIVPEDIAPPQPQPTNRKLPKPPAAGLIVDSEDQAWKSKINVTLPDHDLVEIDAQSMQVRRSYTGVGTTLFGLAPRPGSDEVWVANTEARNLVRFEPDVRGHIVDNRVTRVMTGANGTVAPIDLNPGIDYKVLPNKTALHSALAQPTDVAWHPGGKILYVAAFGTDRIGILDGAGNVTGLVEVGNTAGDKTDPRNKKGPRCLAHHPQANLLYVLNRLANSVSVVDTARRSVTREIALPDPTPVSLREGRGFLYDAKLSGNGTAACAACHVDGDMDGLAWDLGDPGGEMFTARPPIGPSFEMHPMKGPMVTQTLKGLAGGAPFHWRGDRPRLQDFNGAFDSLMGKTPLASTDMDDYATFMESIAFPPNPNLPLDRSLPTTPQGTSPADGHTMYTQVPFRSGFTCNTCHTLPTGTNGAIIPPNILNEPQGFVVPQLRNVYKKFGRRNTAQGRISGFGLTHEGGMDDVFDFLGLSVFGPLSTDTTRKTAIQNFLLHLDTGTAPLVGYQVLVDSGTVNSAKVTQEVPLMMQRAAAGDIDLVLRGTVDGVPRSLLFKPGSNNFTSDRTGVGPFTLAELRSRVINKQDSLLVMGVPPGSGTRVGIDRDGDGTLDGDEGVLSYGTGSKGCAGTPALRPNSEPHIGNRGFALICDPVPANDAGLVAISPRQASQPLLGVTVLVDLGVSGSMILAIPTESTAVATIPVPLPNDTTLVGAFAFVQAYFNDTCGSQGLSATQGLKLTLQK